MDINRLQQNWDKWGKSDPMYAVLSDPSKRGGKWDVDEFFQTGLAEISSVLRYLEALHLTIGRRKALDFGCGIGRLTRALASEFEEVSGVDIAPSMIQRARQYNPPPTRCQFHVNAEPDLRIFPDRGFDFIYSNIVLQHMEPRYSRAYIRDFVRILTEGGVAVFQLPSKPVSAPARRPRSGPVRARLLRSVRPVLGAIRQALTGGARPTIDMYCIAEIEVRELVTAEGASVVDITEDRVGGDGWQSLRYCIRKTSVSGLS